MRLFEVFNVSSTAANLATVANVKAAVLPVMLSTSLVVSGGAQNYSAADAYKMKVQETDSEAVLTLKVKPKAIVLSYSESDSAPIALAKVDSSAFSENFESVASSIPQKTSSKKNILAKNSKSRKAGYSSARSSALNSAPSYLQARAAAPALSVPAVASAPDVLAAPESSAPPVVVAAAPVVSAPVVSDPAPSAPFVPTTPVVSAPVILDSAPVAVAGILGLVNEDAEVIVSLLYTDANGDLATACSITPDANLIESTACSCDGAGVCTVGVTGLLNYNGAAVFNFDVTANSVSSAQESVLVTVNSVDDVPVANAISPAALNEDVESIITLSYLDADSDLATACSVSSLTNVSESTACSCDGAGVCTVGVTGAANYSGAASFDYTVTANAVFSNLSLASLNINAADDAPVSVAISPVAFNEDMESIITLSYSDLDSDLATACSVSSLTNVSESTACSCDGAGVCTVGVTGVADYSGAASFNYTVTANSAVSNSSVASLIINNVDDAPVSVAISPVAFNEDVESIITLSYSDADGDLATACAITPDANISESTACSCDGAGVCTVGVTGAANYNGAASFNFNITANSIVSNLALASLNINGVDDAPVAGGGSLPNFNEDQQVNITLAYVDADGDLATSCSIVNPSNVFESQACACLAGTCSVRMTGVANYNGSVSFQYTVDAGGVTSSLGNINYTLNAVDDAPVAVAVNPPAFNEDTESIVTLSYSDIDSDLATACAITPDTNISESTACSCDGAGVCTVGVTGVANYNGAASFNYTVTANAVISNSALASLIINAVDDAPLALTTNGTMTEDLEEIITLGTYDADGDLATSCSASGFVNMSETTACSCDGAGVCTIGATADTNFNGTAWFIFNITANGVTSGNAGSSHTVSPVDDAPVSVAISPAAFSQDTESLITLSYSDADSDLASACAITPDANISESTACSCDGAGVCTVGVTGVASYNGAASFNYTVTANSVTSNVSLASLTINPPNGGLAYWIDSTNSRGEFSSWDGSSFGTTNIDANATLRILAGADGTTRDESIVMGIDSSSSISGKMWDGAAWSPFSFGMGTPSVSFYWGFDVAYESQSGDAMAIWNNGTDLSYRTWNGSIWSAEAYPTYSLVSEPRHMELAASPISNEMVLVVGTAGGDVAMVWDGFAWGDEIILDNSASDGDVYLSYEQSSGHAMVVYGKNADTDAYYRIWNGSSWSIEASVAAAAGVSNEVRWVRLDSDPNSDRIIMGVIANQQYWANVWDGSSWGTSQLLTSTQSTNVNHPNIDVAFESVSGEAFVVFAQNSSTTALSYRKWVSGSGWSTQLAGPTIGTSMNSLSLEPDPKSDKMMLSVQDSTSDLHYINWTGSAWGSVTEVETDSGETKNQPFLFLWNQQ